MIICSRRKVKDLETTLKGRVEVAMSKIVRLVFFEIRAVVELRIRPRLYSQHDQ